MEVSSSTGSASAEMDVMKKAQDVQEKQMQQILDASKKEAEDTAAQKTGVGGNLNITG